MKKRLIALALTLGLASSSCLGPDNLYNSIKNWNADLSDHNWVNEVVFLGLYFIPVYPIALFGDIVIFNTVHYWTGDNPIKDPGDMPEFTNKEK